MSASSMSKKLIKTPKKRKKSLSNEDENPKSQKLNKSSFTEIEFKFMLKDTASVSSALEKFIDQAKKYPDETDFDIVSNFCRSSTEYAEIFNLFEGCKRNKNELCAIFEVFEHTLLRIAGGLEKHVAVAQHICRTLLASHLQVIMFALKGTAKVVKITLKLLTAMVMQSQTTAKDMLMQFNFSHPSLPALWNWRANTETQDVRTCLILFAMSFLYSEDDLVIKQLINTRGFMGEMFPGLINDKSTNIQMILSTLLEKVVHNEELTKTDRIKLFTRRALYFIAQLYQWKQFVSWKDEQQASNTRETELQIGEVEETDEQQVVHGLVHQFLLELCCSLTTGITFHDRSYGISGKNCNTVIHNMISSFQKPYLHTLQCELVIRVLAVCPDLLPVYLPQLKSAMAPRPNSPVWVKCIDFLYKIFEAQPKVSPAFKQHSSVQTQQLQLMAMNTLFPTKDVWACVIDAVKKDERLVQYKALRFTTLITSRIHHTMQFYVTQRHCDASTDVFCASFRESIKKMLPSWHVLLKTWNKLTGGKQETADNMDTSTTDPEQDTDLPHIDDTTMLKCILEYLCVYQKVLPPSVQPLPIDYKALLEGFQTKAHTMSDQAAVSQLTMYILQLLSESEDRNISWTKKSSGNKTFLRLLLEMITIQTEDERMKSNCRRLVSKMLCTTGLFDGNEEDLNIWLLTLSSANPEHRQDVAAFSEQVFFKLLKDPYTHTEAIIQYSSEAAGLELHRHDDTLSVATSSHLLVDMILSMDEVSLQEDSVQTSDPENYQQAAQRFPFSGLLPCACSLLTTDQSETPVTTEHTSPEVTSREVRQFLFSVVWQMLRAQTDPLPLCLLLLKHQELLGARHLRKISRFLPKKLRKEIKTPKKSLKRKQDAVHNEMLPELMTELELLFESEYDFTEDSGDKRRELAAMVEAVQLEDCVDLVKQILLYLRTELVISAKVNESNMRVYLDILRAIIQRLCVLANTSNATNTSTDNDIDIVENTSNENPNATHESSTYTENLGSECTQQPLESDLDKDKHNGDSTICVYELPESEQQSPQRVLVQVLTLVFQHPTVQNAFLWHEELDTESSSKFRKRMRTVSNILSHHISELVKSLQNHDISKSSAFYKLVHYYVFRLESVIGANTMQSEDVDKCAILQTLCGFLSYLTGSVLVKCLQLIANQSINSLIDTDTKSLTNNGQMLVDIIGLVLNNNAINFSSVIISEDTIMRLLELGLRTDVLDEVISSVFQSLPRYSGYVTNRLLHRYMTNKAHVVLLWLRHSTACREWFEQWLRMGSDDTVRMPRHLPLISACLKLHNGSRALLETLRRGVYEELVKCTVATATTRGSEELLHAQRHVFTAIVDYVDTDGHGVVSKSEIKDTLMELLQAEPHLSQSHVTRLQFIRHLRGIPSHRDDLDLTTMCFRNGLKGLLVAKEDSAIGQKLQKNYLEFLFEILDDIHDCKVEVGNKLINDVRKVSDCDVLGNKELVEVALSEKTTAPFLMLIKQLVELQVNKTSEHNVVLCNNTDNAGDTETSDDETSKKSDEVGSIGTSTKSSNDESESNSDEEMKDDERTSEVDQTRMPLLKSLYENLMSHQRLTEVMLDATNYERKGAVLDVMLSIVARCGAVCHTAHLSLLFGAYTATLSAQDRKVLHLLQLYEQHGCKLSEYKPYLWGAKATEYYSNRENMGASLWRQPSVDQVFELMDSDKMYSSALQFPLSRKLQKEVVAETGDAQDTHELDDCYDCCFILPMLNGLLSSENVVNCRQFVEVNCLGYTLCALSSHDANMRALAYGVLARFYYHLEGARFMEQRQIAYVLDLVRSSLNKNNQRLPCIITVFLAKCAALMLKPNDHMYSMLNSFILCKPSMDLLNVPEFYKLFNSSAYEYKHERSWLLGLLIDGLRETADFRVFEKRYTMKLILSFHDSALSDIYTQKQVLAVIARACKLKSVAFDLTKHHAILPWLSGVIHSRGMDEKSGHVIEILSNLWCTTLDNRDRDLGVRPRKSAILPLQFMAQVFNVLCDLLHSIRSFSKSSELQMLVNIFASLIKHNSQRCDQLTKSTPDILDKEVNLITLRPDDVLLLLFHWSSMEPVAEECASFCATSQALLRCMGKCLDASVSTREAHTIPEQQSKSTPILSPQFASGDSCTVPVIQKCLVEKLEKDVKFVESISELFSVISHASLDHFGLCSPSALDLSSIVVCIQWCLQLNLLLLECRLEKKAVLDWLDSQVKAIKFIHKFRTSDKFQDGVEKVLESAGVRVMLEVTLGKCLHRAVCEADQSVSRGFAQIAQMIQQLV